jgi:hypothetical protein
MPTRAKLEHLVKFLEDPGRSCKILKDLVQELEISCRFLQVLDEILNKILEEQAGSCART